MDVRMGAGLLSVDGLLVGLAPLAMAETAGLECEPFTGGFFGQPANGVTSLAFVVAGIAIAAGNRGERTSRHLFAALVAATGVGSVIQHGPNPSWADLAHDLPLIVLIAYVAVDAAAALTDRRLSHAWWIAPSLALVPVILAAPQLADVIQAALAAVAIGASLQRARLRPELRATLFAAMLLLGTGALIGTLSRSGWPLCRPDSLLQGHAIWHVLAAAALWRLTPAVGRLREQAASQPV